MESVSNSDKFEGFLRLHKNFWPRPGRDHSDREDKVKNIISIIFKRFNINIDEMVLWSRSAKIIFSTDHEETKNLINEAFTNPDVGYFSVPDKKINWNWNVKQFKERDSTQEFNTISLPKKI